MRIVSNLPCATKQEEHVTIPMSDGIHLAIDLILPTDDERAPFPTVVTATRSWRSFAKPPESRPCSAAAAAAAAIAPADVPPTFANR